MNSSYDKRHVKDILTMVGVCILFNVLLCNCKKTSTCKKKSETMNQMSKLLQLFIIHFGTSLPYKNHPDKAKHNIRIGQQHMCEAGNLDN